MPARLLAARLRDIENGEHLYAEIFAEFHAAMTIDDECCDAHIAKPQGVIMPDKWRTDLSPIAVEQPPVRGC